MRCSARGFGEGVGEGDDVKVGSGVKVGEGVEVGPIVAVGEGGWVGIAVDGRTPVFGEVQAGRNRNMPTRDV